MTFSHTGVVGNPALCDSHQMDTSGHQALATTFPCMHGHSEEKTRLLATAGGFFRRGISGGERKRVSVGHELLINPSIILLDEPTSGLDSTTAMNLVSTLCQLAAGGRAIIATIHQPSSRLYQQLDKLLLLSDGHAMYYGECLPRNTLFCCALLDPLFGEDSCKAGCLVAASSLTIHCWVNLIPGIQWGSVNTSLCCACACDKTRMPVRQLPVV